VRTLHHYDEIGLLTPSDRTLAGYRLYSSGEVRRLYRIVALRRLGLRLDEIRDALEGNGADLGDIVRRQLQAVDRQLGELKDLRLRLQAIEESLARRREPSVDELIETMEVMTMYDKYFDAGQQQQLARRRSELGEEAVEQAQSDWAELFDALRREMQAGTDPADPRLDALRAKAAELVEAFTGGDPRMSGSLSRMWSSEDPEIVSHGMVERDLWEYYSRVCRAYA
jgi:MerR family transcriptional regulator, thiopeptide resistance regulator